MSRVVVLIVTGCFIALAAVSNAYAQDPAPKPVAKAKAADKPVAKPVPKLDAEALRIPNSIHETQAKTIDRSQKALPPPSAPNKVDLGAYDLEFRAKHSSDVNPRTGFDSGEKQNLSNSTVGRKSDSVLPNYFGLKLSAPTN